MNEMYDCSGCFDRFGGVIEPPDGYYFMTNAQMAEVAELEAEQEKWEDEADDE